MPLLLLADPSRAKVEAYLARSRCFVARVGAEVVGAYVITPLGEGALELMNIAIAEPAQGRGLGKRLLAHAIETARSLGANRLEVGTGTFGYQLAFYQRAGFRVDRIDKDFFLTHYEAPIFEDGIQHKDMLRLALSF